MSERGIRGGVGAPQFHDSAALHVSGRARYCDDIPEPRDLLHAALGLSPLPRGRIRRLDLGAVRDYPGVVAVLAAEDLPGENNFGAVLHDDPILAGERIDFAGQALFAVAAESLDAARRAVRLAVLEVDREPPLLSPREAVAAESFVLPSERLTRGDAAAAIDAAPRRITGSISLGGQDHFYLEGQIAMALPRDDGDLLIHSSTQYPAEVQQVVAHALGRAAMEVMVECRRMGGAFGGKESQPAQIACIAAILAAQTGRPVKLRLDRDDDMLMTGKRHAFEFDYRAGFDDDGRIRGVEFEMASLCGNSADLSGPVNDRAMFHCDNAYFLENLSVVSHRCRTNTVSNTAFRGFGGPQGMFAIEQVVDEIARQLGRDPLDVRRANFYGLGERDTTHYGQRVEDNVLHELCAQLEAGSDYRARRAAIAEFNRESPVLKRGIALTPVKFGISFTATHLNQAGALLHVYSDGSVLLNHGGTEMGQGLFTKVAQVVAEELQIDFERIRISASDTARVPNASATAASSGSDLNGKAAQAAARTIRERLSAFAAERFDVAEGDVRFAANRVHAGEAVLEFGELARLAHTARVPLSATGFYATPKIHYDRKTFSGRPFYYYACGAAVAEVAVDTLTGEHRLLRADILHDCGKSLNPAIDRGQIEGAFIQGMGWLTSEELVWNPAGQLATHAPSTYKIPGCADVPADLRVELFDAANREDTIHRSRAVGEPPLMLGLSVFHALRDALAACAGSGDGDGDAASDRGISVPLQAPATPEAVLRAIDCLRGSDQRGGDERGGGDD